MFHCLKINQLLAPSGRWCFSHMKGFWVTPSWACVFFQGGEDRQAVSVPEHCQVGRSLFQGGCGEHRGPRGGGPRVSLAGEAGVWRAVCSVGTDWERQDRCGAGGRRRGGPHESKPQKQVWSTVPGQATEKSTPRPSVVSGREGHCLAVGFGAVT